MNKTPEFVCVQPGHRMRVVSDRVQLPPLAWIVELVAASPRRDSPAYDSLLAQTFGSSADWGDELRFDNSTRGLRSIILAIPEQEGSPTDVEIWSRAPVVAGSLSPDDMESYVIDTVDTRVLAGDGKTLLCQLDGPAPSSPWRLALSPDLHLLFDHERYAGWLLSTPLAYLRPWNDGISAAAPEDEATPIEIIQELHQMLTREVVDALFDDDAAAMARLDRLAARASALPEGRARDVLRDKILSVKENAVDTIAATKSLRP
jgi:hypothetical protein